MQKLCSLGYLQALITRVPAFEILLPRWSCPCFTAFRASRLEPVAAVRLQAGLVLASWLLEVLSQRLVPLLEPVAALVATAFESGRPVSRAKPDPTCDILEANLTPRVTCSKPEIGPGG